MNSFFFVTCSGIVLGSIVLFIWLGALAWYWNESDMTGNEDDEPPGL